MQSRKQPATCPGPEWPLRGRDPTGDGRACPSAVPHRMGTGLHTLVLSGSLTHTVPAPQFGGDFRLRDPGAPPPPPTSPDNVHGCGPRLEEVRGLVHLRHTGEDPLPGTLEGRAVRTSPQAQKAAPGAAWPQAGLSPPGFAAPRAGWSLGDHLPPSAWPQALMPLSGRTQQRKEGQGTPGGQNHGVPEARTYGLWVCTPRPPQNTHPVHACPHHSSPNGSSPAQPPRCPAPPLSAPGRCSLLSRKSVRLGSSSHPPAGCFSPAAATGGPSVPLGYPAAGMHLPPFSPRQARTQAGREETRRAGVRAAVGGTRVLHPSMLPGLETHDGCI